MQQKRSRHARVFDYPWCIYCGGKTPATTVDHVPARNLFNGRIRPKGLEFPSCDACNAGTKGTELVVAVVSRALPDATAEWSQELEDLLRGVSNNFPEALRELKTPRAKARHAARRLGVSEETGFLNLDGPVISAHLKAFAAKFAFAFHFFKTGQAVPEGGGVVTMAYSNVNLIDGTIPGDFVGTFGEPSTLQQGMKHVGDQFRYAAQATEDGKMTMAFASFRQSFAIATFSGDDVNKLMVDGEMPETLFRPGDLQKSVPRPEFLSINHVYVMRPVFWRWCRMWFFVTD